jgi:AraC-like DNA-binding protein
MGAQAPATQPSAVTIDEIREATAVGAGIELIDLDAVQLKSQPLQAQRTVVRLDVGAVVFHSTNVRMRTRTTSRQDLGAYVAFGPQARGTANGLAVRPGVLLAVAPGTEVMFVAEAGYESIAFLVSTDVVREHLAARGREADFRPQHGAEMLQADFERVRVLYEWGRRLLDAAKKNRHLFDEGRPARAAAQAELLELLLAALDAASSIEVTRGAHTQQARSAIVRAAEDHALSRIPDRAQVTDLCRAAGVSERALEYAFKEVTGLTPVQFLIRLRLHRVRQALLASTQESDTVASEALRWGFWHFGEFSRAYKACFGELPSETLRRRSAERAE